MVTAIRQGHCCVSVIDAAKVKPEVFGLSLPPAAVVEDLPIFAFVFALVPAGSIPAAACPFGAANALPPGQHEPGLNP